MKRAWPDLTSCPRPSSPPSWGLRRRWDRLAPRCPLRLPRNGVCSPAESALDVRRCPCQFVRAQSATHGFDVALDTEIAENHESRQDRVLFERRIDGDDEGNSGFARHMVAQQIDSFDVE